MANCCFGTLDIIASDDLLKRILEALHGKDLCEDIPLDFNKIIPMPQSDVEDGHEWRIQNWGTTGICDCVLHENSYSFWTKWAPCTPVIRKLSEMFPDARFEYWYEENGMGFCGREAFENGKPLYTMSADFTEHYIGDDDENNLQFNDYREGHIDEHTSYYIHNGYKIGDIKRREDIDGYVRIIDGTFCEAV